MENGIFLFVCIGLIAAWGESDGKLLTGEELLSCSLADFYTKCAKGNSEAVPSQEPPPGTSCS